MDIGHHLLILFQANCSEFELESGTNTPYSMTHDPVSKRALHTFPFMNTDVSFVFPIKTSGICLVFGTWGLLSLGPMAVPSR